MAMAMAMAALAGTLIPPPLLPLPRPRSLNPRTTSPPRLHRLAVAASGGGDGGPPASEGRPPSLPPLKDIRWGELLAPQPANAAAVALTAALTWAGASLLLQLVLISASIFAAAVKYSFVAALLLFVLIALL